jgi:hypothetical protein
MTRREASAAAIRDLRSRMIERTKVTPGTTEEAATNDKAPHVDHDDSHSEILGKTATIPVSIHNPESRAWYREGYGISTPFQETPDRETHRAPTTGDNVFPWNPQAEASGAPRYPSIALTSDPATFSNIMQGSQMFNQNTEAASFGTLDPFSGFDIPFWFEQDQHWDFFQDFV